jgi:hypothetical protein
MTQCADRKAKSTRKLGLAQPKSNPECHQVKWGILKILIQWRRKSRQWIDFLIQWSRISGEAVSRASHP